MIRANGDPVSNHLRETAPPIEEESPISRRHSSRSFIQKPAVGVEGPIYCNLPRKSLSVRFFNDEEPHVATTLSTPTQTEPWCNTMSSFNKAERNSTQYQAPRKPARVLAVGQIQKFRFLLKDILSRLLLIQAAI